MAHALSPIRNGVDMQHLADTLDAIGGQPELGAFTFRATNRWLNGAHSRSTIKGFFGAGADDATRTEAFLVDAGEPAVLLGTDSGPNPAEYLLHALAACLTTTLVYDAATRAIRLREVESTFEGEMDVRGRLGIDDAYRNGFTRIRGTFRIEAEAPDEQMREIVERARTRSAVYDMVANGVPVEIEAA